MFWYGSCTFLLLALFAFDFNKAGTSCLLSHDVETAVAEPSSALWLCCWIACAIDRTRRRR